MCKNLVFPPWFVVIFGALTSDNTDPLTCQPIIPVVALQLKVAVDLSVALIDVGVLTKPKICS